MMSLSKTVHTLLGIPHAVDRRNPHHRCREIPSIDGGGLRILAGDAPKPPNVVESSAVGPAGKPPKKVDPGVRGLFDQNEDRLGLCTESLGCESCDERVGMDAAEVAAVAAKTEDGRRSRRRGTRSRRRGEEAKFPPPLPWLSGRRSTFLQPIRRDGRFVLTEVRIERPEIFQASRFDGRLRLDLIRSDDVKGEEDAPPPPAEAAAEQGEDMEVRKVGGGGGEERSGGREWGQGRSERFSRCQEAVSGNGIPLWWSHRYVTTA